MIINGFCLNACFPFRIGFHQQQLGLLTITGFDLGAGHLPDKCTLFSDENMLMFSGNHPYVLGKSRTAFCKTIRMKQGKGQDKAEEIPARFTNAYPPAW